MTKQQNMTNAYVLIWTPDPEQKLVHSKKIL